MNVFDVMQKAKERASQCERTAQIEALAALLGPKKERRMREATARQFVAMSNTWNEAANLIEELI
jgi:hypothetical protein